MPAAEVMFFRDDDGNAPVVIQANAVQKTVQKNEFSNVNRLPNTGDRRGRRR